MSLAGLRRLCLLLLIYGFALQTVAGLWMAPAFGSPVCEASAVLGATVPGDAPSGTPAHDCAMACLQGCADHAAAPVASRTLAQPRPAADGVPLRARPAIRTETRAASSARGPPAAA
jgi:hypothetical protein